MLSVHLENGRITVHDVPKPDRPTGYALIRTLIAGICNTDLELQRGYYGFSGTPGHEFAGEVVDADDSDLIGKRVAGEINLSCGVCPYCRRSLGRHCPDRTVLGIVKHPGAFQEFFTLPERNLHLIPDAIPTESAVFIEPLAAACEVLDQVRIPAGETVAVLGDGKLGLLISQALHAYGAKVLQYGRHRDKLLIAARAGIDTASINATLPDAEFDFVIDATGSREGLRNAVKMVKPRGTVIMKSTVHGEVAIDTAPVIVNEITLLGSRCGRFEPAMELLRLGTVKVAPLIAGRFPLSAAPEAFARAAEKGVLKVLLNGSV
jgi:threonine dehydrogenase-like Zn-dependent dehydrogenase